MDQIFDEYKGLFVQRIPSYAVKAPGKSWYTYHKKLHDEVVKKHLEQKKSVAVLGQWYPQYCAFDFDDFSISQVEDIRAGLKLDEDNSMLFNSESPNSYHLYCRPLYREKPPTIRLLQSALKSYARTNNIEVYPQKNRAFRLPFGQGQSCADFQDRNINGWKDQLYWLQKKDDFDLGSVPRQQLILDFPRIEKGAPFSKIDFVPDTMGILENGLQAPSTRDYWQFELIKCLFRENLPMDDTAAVIWNWISKRHNGFSKDFLRNPQQVYSHIQHQVQAYYQWVANRGILPDSTKKIHEGYITQSDILKIIDLCKGNLPLMRFVYNLVKFMNPRRERACVPIHSDTFSEWVGKKSKTGSGADFLKHLNFLEGKGILKRSRGYIIGRQSKLVSLKWDYKSDADAVLYKGRSVNSLSGAVRMLFGMSEFKELLRNYVKRTTAIMTANRLFLGKEEHPSFIAKPGVF